MTRSTQVGNPDLLLLPLAAKMLPPEEAASSPSAMLAGPRFSCKQPSHDQFLHISRNAKRFHRRLMLRLQSPHPCPCCCLRLCPRTRVPVARACHGRSGPLLMAVVSLTFLVEEPLAQGGSFFRRGQIPGRSDSIRCHNSDGDWPSSSRACSSSSVHVIASVPKIIARSTL